MRTVAFLAALLLAGPLAAAEKAEKPASGLEKGAGVPAFDVVDVTGPNAPNKLCYIWRNGSKPVVLLFTSEIDGPLTGLVKKIDAFVKDNKKSNATAFVVLLGKPDDDAKAKLKKIAKDEKLEIPLTISFEKDATAKSQKLNEKVKTTVIVYRDKKVKASFALDKIEGKDVEAVLAAAKEAASSS